LSVIVNDPYGKLRAYLVDLSGAMFEAVEGDVVDGRYRVTKLTKDCATVAFREGTYREGTYPRTMCVR